MDKNARRYVQRDYRLLYDSKNLQYFQVVVKETDLAVGVDKESYTGRLLSLCREQVLKLRGDLESYIDLHPRFKTSFVPLPTLPGAPAIACTMAEAAAQAGVGPMAAVAGAFAQAVGEYLKPYVRDIIVENGGDIYLHSNYDRLISVFAGKSRFSHKIALRIEAGESPLGICTSSGTVGPSISLGKADAVVIKGINAALADAVATGAANLVQNEGDVTKPIDYVRNIEGITGILAIKNDKLAAWGKIEIVPLG